MKDALPLACLLFVVPLTAQGSTADARFDLAVLEREYAVAQRAWLEALRSGQQVVESPSKVFVDRCLLAAGRQRGTAAAVPFLAWIVRHATDERAAVEKALQVLTQDHLTDPGWAAVLDVLPSTRELVGAELLSATIERVLSANELPAVRARALAARAALRWGNAASGASGDEARAMILADLEAAREVCTEQSLRAELVTMIAVLVGRERCIVHDDHELAVRVALREGKPLLVSMVGFNCGSCRLVEGPVMSQAQLAALLARVVESRLHVDVKNTLTAERFAENLALQKSLSETTAMPLFCVVDPRTGRVLRQASLKGGPGDWGAVLATLLGGDAVKDGADGR